MMNDRIGRSETAWITAHPDLDPWPLRILGRVMRLNALLEQQSAVELAKHGVHAGEVEVLAALRRALPDFTTTPKELSKLTLVTSAAVTSRLNSLESKGLISRRTDERSRRSVLVSLTPKGFALFEEYLRNLVAKQSELTNQLTEAQRAACADALGQLILLVENDGDEGIRARPPHDMSLTEDDPRNLGREVHALERNSR